MYRIYVGKTLDLLLVTFGDATIIVLLDASAKVLHNLSHKIQRTEKTL